MFRNRYRRPHFQHENGKKIESYDTAYGQPTDMGGEVSGLLDLYPNVDDERF